jgi:hypothetical protein
VINEWIVPGGPTLTVFLNWPANQPFVAGKAKISVSLFLADPQAPTPTPQQVLARFDWPISNVPEAYPFNFSRPIRIVDLPPQVRLWSEAEKIELLNADDRQQMLGVLEKFRLAIIQGQAEKAYDLSAYKFTDDALANGNDPKDIKAVAIQQYVSYIRQAEVHSEGLTGDNANFQILAAKQVVLVSRASEPHGIVIKGNRMTVRIKTYFAKIAGKWQIVR